MKDEKYSRKVLHYIAERYSNKTDGDYFVIDSKLVFINKKNAVISYRIWKAIGINTEVGCVYKNREIVVNKSLLDKAKYYESIYNKIYKELGRILDECRKSYYDCIIIVENSDDGEYKFKSEEHRIKADEILKNYHLEEEKLKKKYNIEYISFNIYNFLDRYIKIKNK